MAAASDPLVNSFIQTHLSYSSGIKNDFLLKSPDLMWIFIAFKKYRFVLETVVSTGILIHEPTRFHILARNGIESVRR